VIGSIVSLSCALSNVSKHRRLLAVAGSLLSLNNDRDFKRPAEEQHEEEEDHVVEQEGQVVEKLLLEEEEDLLEDLEEDLEDQEI
jgi:hypothetical protein